MKTVKIVAYLALLLFLLSFPVYAQEDGASLEDKVESALDGLLPDELIKDDGGFDAEKFGFDYFLRKFGGDLSRSLTEVGQTAGAILALLIISSLLNTFTANTLSDGVSAAYALSESLSLSLLLFAPTLSILEQVQAFTAELTFYMNGMLPIMETVYISSGNINSAAVHTGGLMLSVTVIQNFIDLAIIPISRACFLLAIAASVNGGARLRELTSFVKKLFTTLLVMVMAILSFVLGIQTILARGADGLAVKTVKFALSSFIPIVGGSVSEAVNTVTAGTAAIKSTVGCIGIVLIALILLPTLATLIVYRAVLSLMSMTAGLCDAGRVSAVLNEISGICSMLLAAVCASSLLFFLAMILFSGTTAV